MAERQGVEIDYCPRCRGIWLDRGELDKILERSNAEYGETAAAAHTPSPSRSADSPDTHRHEDDTPRHGRQGHGESHGKGGGKKKSSFLTDILGGFGGEGD